MIYEVINPHTPCTFEAPDLEVAALSMGIFSNNLYGAEPEDPAAEDLPPFPMGGVIDWWKTQFKQTPEDRISVRHNEIFNALKTMLYGSFEDRQDYATKIAVIANSEQREIAFSAWKKERLTSQNDIVEQSWQIADQFAATMKE